jgi:hypothetical protein
VKFLFLIPAMVFAIGFMPMSSTADDGLTNAIQYLLDFVKNSDCTLIRNGKNHTAQEAVAHIKRKYNHFKDEIKTPEDFIRLTASKSLISRKPYMVKTSDGRILRSQDWLLNALKDYRLEKMSSDK